MAAKRRYNVALLAQCFILSTIPLSVLTTTSTSSPSEPPSSPGTEVPGKVTDLNVTYVSASTVGLSWKPPDTMRTGYAIAMHVDGACTKAVYLVCNNNDTIYAQGEDCPYNTVGTPVCQDTIYYNVTGLMSYTDYVINVVATIKFTHSDNTTVEASTHIGIPKPPSNVELKVINTTAIEATWVKPTHYAGPTNYHVKLLAALDREITGFLEKKDFTVNGYNTTSLVIGGLLSSWRYMVGVAAFTDDGMSGLNMSKPVRTLPSTPSAVHNLTVGYVSDQYMAVVVSWWCPYVTERNGQITGYTVQAAGKTSLTLRDGDYYPEDPCLGQQFVSLPVEPNTHYNITVFANAEYKGEESTVSFYADLAKMVYIVIPPGNRTAGETDSSSLIIASSVLGSFIVVEILVIVAFFIPRS